MNNNYSIADINAVSQVINELFFKYTNEPYYLKQTLREIRSLVHQANLKADKLIEADWFKDFNAEETLNILQQEFSNLTWETRQTDIGYGFTGQLGQLHIEIDYKVSLISSLIKGDNLDPYWEVDVYLEQSDWIITLSKDRSKLVSLEVAIHYINDTLLPVKKVFDTLNLI